VKLLVRLRPRLSYANVIATLALFLVLGGGAAFAATQLPKNSVGAKQLKKHAVTPAKLSKSTLSKLQGAKGPAGPAGAVGPAGAKGSAGEDAGPAYFATSEEEGSAFPAGEHSQLTALALKNIPAGSYTVSFTGEVFNGNKGAIVIECGISSEGGNPADLETAAGLWNLPPKSTEFSATEAVALQSVVTFGSDGGELVVPCLVLEGKVEVGAEPDENKAGIVLPSLILTKVPSVSVQEFSAPPVSSSVLRELSHQR
jgi:hypothetical protein